LRRQARRGAAGPDFAERELELLHHLWQRRDVAAPALTYAAQATGRLRPHRLPTAPYAHPFPQHTQYGGYGYNPYLAPHRPPPQQ
ncbi:PrsW family intramembrane metalloprotease, partial [Streptomyces sp. NPDC058409]